MGYPVNIYMKFIQEMIIIYGLVLTMEFLVIIQLDKSVKSYLVADGLQDYEFNGKFILSIKRWRINVCW